MPHGETASGIVIPPTYEEAKRCPKCQEPGRETNIKQLGRLQGSANTIMCENERCKWFGTGWVVQVLPDGTIPVRAKGQPKQFEPYTAGQEAMARRQLEQISMEQNLDRKDF